MTLEFCKSLGLLIGDDELMIETFSIIIIIRCCGGVLEGHSSLLTMPLSEQMRCFPDCGIINLLNVWCPAQPLSVAFYVSGSFVYTVPVLKVPLQKNATEASPVLGLGLFSLSLKNLIYFTLVICNLQFAVLCRTTILLDFFFFLSPITILLLQKVSVQCWKSDREEWRAVRGDGFH